MKGDSSPHFYRWAKINKIVRKDRVSLKKKLIFLVHLSFIKHPGKQDMIRLTDVFGHTLSTNKRHKYAFYLKYYDQLISQT